MLKRLVQEIEQLLEELHEEGVEKPHRIEFLQAERDKLIARLEEDSRQEDLDVE